MPDIQLSDQQAADLHWDHSHTCVIMWVVTWNPSDYPMQAVARPRLITTGGDVALNSVLLANTLDDLRLRLPTGLVRLDRSPEDDPVIVEIWF
jgi:hypothetical protein